MIKTRFPHLCFQCTLFVLILIVLGQAAQQVKKYLNRQVTISRSTENFAELHLPDISICPGFKKQKALEHEWMKSILQWRLLGNESFPKTREDAEVLWKDLTYAADEIFKEVFLNRGTPIDVERVSAKQLLQGAGDDCLSLLEHDTLSGKCYTVHFNCPFSMVDTSVLFLNYTLMPSQNIPLFFHYKGAFYGLNENYWPIQVATTDIHIEEFADIAIRKHIKKRSTLSTEEDFYSCLENKLKSSVDALDDDFCYFPSFRSILELAGPRKFPPCSNTTSYLNSFSHIRTLLLDYINMKECEIPNNQAVYFTTRRTQRSVGDQNITALNIYLETLEVTIEEEYVLLDFPMVAFWQPLEVLLECFWAGLQKIWPKF